MITKSQLKGDSIEKYFDAILEAQIKGEDIHSLIQILSQRQKNRLSEWINDPQLCKYHHSYIDEVKKSLYHS